MKTFFVFLSILPAVFMLGHEQSVAVKGKLMCGEKPAKDVLIKMYEGEVFVDALLDEQKSDSEGNFHLSGSAVEVSSIEPHVNIYHDCDDTLMPCQRRLTVGVPDGFTNRGAVPKKEFDLGVIQLAGIWSGETRDCLHKRK